MCLFFHEQVIPHEITELVLPYLGKLSLKIRKQLVNILSNIPCLYSAQKEDCETYSTPRILSH